MLTGSIDDFPILQVAVTSDLTPGELEAALESQAVTDLTEITAAAESGAVATGLGVAN